MADTKLPEDEIIDFYHDLKKQEGFVYFLQWLNLTRERLIQQNLNPQLPIDQTNFLRGQIDGLKLAINGVDMLIAQREEELVEEEKNKNV